MTIALFRRNNLILALYFNSVYYFLIKLYHKYIDKSTLLCYTTSIKVVNTTEGIETLWT
nr:MAG TPA: hypothetical protein [Caudoviricetes sp.]